MLEGFGVKIRWPLKIWCDSAGAISVKNDTCLVSKIRGAFDYKEDWGKISRSLEFSVEVLKIKEVMNLADPTD